MVDCMVVLLRELLTVFLVHPVYVILATSRETVPKYDGPANRNVRGVIKM